MTTLEPWARDPDHLEHLMLHCLRERDFHGVIAALKLMALCDPHRAQILYDTLQLGLTLADTAPAPAPGGQP